MTVELDKEFEKVLYSPVCCRCTHFDFSTAVTHRRCAAYPERLPDEIWRGDNDHTAPYPGDHGVTFKQRVVPRPNP